MIVLFNKMFHILDENGEIRRRAILLSIFLDVDDRLAKKKDFILTMTFCQNCQAFLTKLSNVLWRHINADFTRLQMKWNKKRNYG